MERPAEVGMRLHRPFRRRVQQDRRCVGKEATIAHLEVAFRLHVFGEQDVVAVELDVPVSDALYLFLKYRRAINQRRCRDQHLAEHVEADRMAWRDDEVAAPGGLAQKHTPRCARA